MKRWISFFGHLAIVTILTSFATLGFSPEPVAIPIELLNKGQIVHEVPPYDLNKEVDNKELKIFLGKSFLGFKEALAFKESTGIYDTINTLGYLGKYQFGRGTLKLMGVTDTCTFLEDAALQEKLFRMNVARNKWILRRDIKRFVGKRINGVMVTESGIVAAAHLAGAGNVKKYLRSYGQVDFSDAYGTSVAYYLKRFRGYDISEVKAKHNPKV